MLIRVQYNDKSYGMVDDSTLESLISGDEIIRFQRSSRWVRIGIDKVRSQEVERRRKGAIINIYV